MYLVSGNWSLDQELRSSSQKQGPGGKGEMAREDGQELESEAAPMLSSQVPKGPCFAVVCRKAGWREMGILCHGRARRQRCSRQGCQPCWRPLSGGSLKQLKTPLVLHNYIQLVLCQEHQWRCPGLLASPGTQSFCGLCCDKPPWAEPHKSAINEPAHEESFNSGTIYLLWLWSSLMCLQHYNLHQ